MKIITGKAKGISLQTLEGNATRPTSQRVKEAVFSMIQFDIEGRHVLDLFAGCGQMALEAISRGAASAVLVDASREASQVIRANVQRARMTEVCEIYTLDYRQYLRSCHKAFDLVFIDPPYADGIVADALRLLLQNGCLKEGTLLVCESGKEDIFEQDESLKGSFEILRQARYSISYITLLQRKGERTDG